MAQRIFDYIDNFRDVSETIQQSELVCPGIVYRSATLDYATDGDLKALTEELGINTIIDLRSELEAQLSMMGKPFTTFPVSQAVLKLKPSDIVEHDPQAKVKEKADGPTRKTIMINFAGAKYRKYAVWKAAPLKIKMQIVALVAANNKPKAVQLVGQELLSRKGLSGLYRDFVDYCGNEICEALMVFTDRSNYPVLVHCTQGKDRTGLVIALALASANVEEHKIVEDFHKSQAGLDRVRSMMVKEMAKNGLDPSFADAPAHVLEQTFDYLDEKYGGKEAYLDYIGFTRPHRENLRKQFVFLPPSALLSPGGTHIIDKRTGERAPHPPQFEGETFFSEVLEEAVKMFSDSKSRYSSSQHNNEANRQKGPKNKGFLTTALGSAVSTFATGCHPPESKSLMSDHNGNNDNENDEDHQYHYHQ